MDGGKTRSGKSPIVPPKPATARKSQSSACADNSSPGQAVYEPFSGSGTTIIAAEMTGRICHAIELAPAYVDVAVKRWQAFTGKTATLESDGRTFDELAATRGAETNGDPRREAETSS